ncbi:MAG: ZIP family metal transporter, partial [Ruminiclostridium sp.]|nr:ZIP family metal transporter [Ruminiclostridium sp.]
MTSEVIRGILIPFFGTALGASCVLIMKNSFNELIERILNGFAGGVMTAASIWSLILPSVEQAEENMGRLSFIPAAVGFVAGIAFLLLLDKLIPCSLGIAGQDSLSGKKLMYLAVTLHNIPEGMAVGAVYAGLIYGDSRITAASAAALALGIAIQNLPEGAIISMPLHAGGTGKAKAFIAGTLSGAVEPAGAVLTVCAAGLIVPALPYLLSFAAGAMIYVVVNELIPEMSQDGHPEAGTISFSAG